MAFLSFAGAVIDLAASDLDRAEAFYVILLGRNPDLRPQADQREWILHRHPEVALRLTGSHPSAGQSTLSLGVADLEAERSRLAEDWADIPEAVEKPGVITLLRLRDPDRNQITLWQDLLGR